MARYESLEPRQIADEPRGYIAWLLLPENRGHLFAHILGVISIGCFVFVMVNR